MTGIRLRKLLSGIGTMLFLFGAVGNWADAQNSAAPFALNLKYDAEASSKGMGIFVIVTETNKSDAVVNCGVRDTNGVDLSLDYSVWGPSGRLMEPRKDASSFPDSASVCELRPKASFSRDEWISWLYGMSEPGHYRVQVSRGTSDRPGGGRGIQSNTIVIDVKPQGGSTQ